MSKRHTLGISKWLPSTKDKITFEITLRPSTPDISKHLCICVYVFYRPSSNQLKVQLQHKITEVVVCQQIINRYSLRIFFYQTFINTWT